MPIFRRPRRVLLHVVCCAVTSGENVDICCKVFFVVYCVVNLDGTSCVCAIHSNIQLSPTIESETNIHFLDLSITRRQTCLNISSIRGPRGPEGSRKLMLPDYVKMVQFTSFCLKRA